MDCLRSFVVDASLNQSWTVGPNLKTWTIAGNHYWYGRTLSSAEFNVQGFKNINVFGIDVIGDFKSGPTPTICLIDNWEVSVNLIGQAPLIGGNINPIPNDFNLNQSEPFVRRFVLSKFKRDVKFSTPFQSVNQITFEGFTASGHGNQSLTDVTVNWDLNFVIYYKFEGE